MTEPLEVYCGECAAGPNSQCVDPLTGDPLDEPHEGRIRLARAKS